MTESRNICTNPAMKLPEIIQYKSAIPGPHLVVSGAIHGNEKCGTEAISRVIDCITSGRISLTRGSVTLIPVSNPLASKNNIRFINRDLNRNMYPRENPQSYEDHLDNVLCAAFRKADALLDLHSYTAPGEAFVFLGPPRKSEADYARALGVRNFAHGWQDSAKDPLEAQGTTEYTRQSGALAVTLECGSHNDPEAVEVAFQAILNALEYFGLATIDPDLFDPRPVAYGPEQVVRKVASYDKDEEGRLARAWRNMDPVKKGDLLAEFNSGRQIRAPEDGYILMPVANEKVGEKGWFHFGVKSDYFSRLEPGS